MPQLSSLLAATATVTAATLAFDLLLFAPKEGSEVERTATWTESTSATDVMILLDGEETTEVPTVSTSFERELTVESKEQFVRCADGRLLELVRRFGPITLEATADIELEMPSGGAELSIEGEGDCELEGIGVRFAWDAEVEEWVKTYADDYEGREELLKDLLATTEFVALLPEEADVDVGDQWDVDIAALFDLLKPGGTLPLKVETDLQAIDGVLDPLRLPGVFDSLVGERDGKVSASVKSIEDGALVIELGIDVSVVSDQLESGAIDLESALPAGTTAELQRAIYDTAIEGRGELTWDLEAGRMSSFVFAATVEIEIELDVDVNADGQDLEFSLREVRQGKIGLTIE